jgi:hypothetical protein
LTSKNPVFENDPAVRLGSKDTEIYQA